jgi:acetyl-CoA carboxylase biotin carboxyl carrier protein
MNKKEIEELIRFVSKSGVNEVSLETKELKITIKNASSSVIQQVYAPAPAALPAAPAPAPAPAQAAPAAAPAQAAPAAPATSNNANYVTVKSPMIGTFYRASGPDKPDFANVGDEIKPGKVVCIIEAMKLFNEIESEISGRIVKVLVDNASPVEYDQPLFLVDPA